MNKPTLAERIRNACAEMRRKPYPIADLIPLMQETADRIELLERLLQQEEGFDDELVKLRVFAQEIRDGKWRGAEARRVATLVLDQALPPVVGLVPPMER